VASGCATWQSLKCDMSPVASMTNPDYHALQVGSYVYADLIHAWGTQHDMGQMR
jgi:hypothetical protein